ncbi:uncharacterized aarF domain-containing protein kinase 2-like isoform X2 [Amphiura filiformis]|uniref:uncharacterized aarF domain-containing protein kinase 2-like isoform X2 n=1 Tax=Amphiura filiformis TaxID=82378 RepID=UPI003B217FB3
MLRNCCIAYKTFSRIASQTLRLQRTHLKSGITIYRQPVSVARQPVSAGLLTPTCRRIVGYSLASCFIARQIFITHNALCLQVHQHGEKHFESLKQTCDSGQYKLIQVFWSIYKYCRLFIRLVWACSLYGPLFTLYPITVYIPSWKQTWLKALLFLVEISGPTFIKLGQWASTRRDLFSADFCNTFAKLHMNAPSHSWHYTARRLEEVFGKEWRDMFVIVETIIHSGCIGQVHKAYMRPDVIEKVKSQVNFGGQFRIPAEEIEGCSDTKAPLIPVAIKILHPGVYNTVHWDIQLLHTLARFCSLIPGVKWLSLTECVEEFEAMMKNQIDLVVEAENLDRFNKNFSNVSCVKFPRPIWPFVTHDILVETYEEGESIATIIQMPNGPDGLKERLAEIGINTLLKMVFVDNFVHADLHPGNILVQGMSDYQPSSSIDEDDVGFEATTVGRMTRKDCPLKLVLLDTGIVSHLNEGDRRNLQQVMLAVTLGKGELAAELLVNHSKTSECHDIETFKAEFAVLVQQVHKLTLQLGQIQVGTLMQDVLNVFIKHKVKFESNFASIVLAVMVLEGLSRSLDPHLDIFEAAKPILLGQSV